jgi:hypothetical protein
MTYKTKRSLAQLGKHARNMPKLQHPDEAPTPSKQRCSHGYPVRRPPTRRRPRRTPPSAPARPPALCEAVCALSPLELMAHLHALPMEDANLHPTPAMLTPFTSSRMLNA